jgi:hypothetical protein
MARAVNRSDAFGQPRGTRGRQINGHRKPTTAARELGAEGATRRTRMKRTNWLTLAGIGVATLLVAAPAQAGSKIGVVETLDRGNMQIKLSDSPAVLVVTDETEIRKDGRRATLADVQEGDEVLASYSRSGDSLEVKKLNVTSKDEYNRPSHEP